MRMLGGQEKIRVNASSVAPSHASHQLRSFFFGIDGGGGDNGNNSCACNRSSLAFTVTIFDFGLHEPHICILSTMVHCFISIWCEGKGDRTKQRKRIKEKRKMRAGKKWNIAAYTNTYACISHICFFPLSLSFFSFSRRAYDRRSTHSAYRDQRY